MVAKKPVVKRLVSKHVPPEVEKQKPQEVKPPEHPTEPPLKAPESTPQPENLNH